ncbi:hypothetical protein FHX14_006344 [Rhizobium sp. BK619]|uniref:hypothetical protein n=1 Tax=Rhizobium sp. BK619 TaxID=2586989 RepID=UPI001612F3F5|nr:hypothetical protein [Rhizobium sp. BK619]
MDESLAELKPLSPEDRLRLATDHFEDRFTAAQEFSEWAEFSRSKRQAGTRRYNELLSFRFDDQLRPKSDAPSIGIIFCKAPGDPRRTINVMHGISLQQIPAAP